MGAIRDEITGGKGRSVTLCPPSGAFYSPRYHVLSHDTSVNVYNCAYKIREPCGLSFFFIIIIIFN